MTIDPALRLLADILIDPAETVPGIDGKRWKTVVRAAREQGLLPMLAHTVEPFAGMAAAEFLQAARPAVLTAAARSIRLGAQLREILSDFHDAGIDCVLLKGSHLAWSVYPDPACRPMGDLDILVSDDDIAPAHQRMTALGYHPGVEPDFSRLTQSHLVFLRDGGVPVEIHWELLRPSLPAGIPPESMRSRSVPFSFQGVPARVLCPMDTLAHLAIHFTMQNLCRTGLRAVFDMDRLLRAEPPAPDEIQALIEHEVLTRPVALSLALTHFFFRTPLPEPVIPPVEAIDGDIVSLAVREVVDGKPSHPSYERVMTNLAGHESGIGKMRYALSMLFPPAQTIRAQYGASTGKISLAGAYLRRWRDLVKHHGTELLPFLFTQSRTRKRRRSRLAIREWLGISPPIKKIGARGVTARPVSCRNRSLDNPALPPDQ